MASGWSEEWEWLECEGESKGLVGGSNRILNMSFHPNKHCPGRAH